jgi:hypothetical protein
MDCDGRTITWWVSALNLGSYLEEIIQSGRLYTHTMNRRNNQAITPLGVAMRRGNSDVLLRLLKIVPQTEGVTYENFDMLTAPFLWKFLRAEEAKRSSDVLQAIRELLKTDDLGVYSKQLKQIPGLEELWPLVKETAKMRAIEEQIPKDHLEYWAKVGQEQARWAYQLDELKVLERWSPRSSTVTMENDPERRLKQIKRQMQVLSPQRLPR